VGRRHDARRWWEARQAVAARVLSTRIGGKPHRSWHSIANRFEFLGARQRAVPADAREVERGAMTATVKHGRFIDALGGSLEPAITNPVAARHPGLERQRSPSSKSRPWVDRQGPGHP
jgi:hypothetical protein